MILLLLALFGGVTSTVSVRAATPETAPPPLYRIEVGTQVKYVRQSHSRHRHAMLTTLWSPTVALAGSNVGRCGSAARRHCKGQDTAMVCVGRDARVVQLDRGHHCWQVKVHTGPPPTSMRSRQHPAVCNADMRSMLPVPLAGRQALAAMKVDNTRRYAHTKPCLFCTERTIVHAGPTQQLKVLRAAGVTTALYPCARACSTVPAVTAPLTTLLTYCTRDCTIP